MLFRSRSATTCLRVVSCPLLSKVILLCGILPGISQVGQAAPYVALPHTEMAELSEFLPPERVPQPDSNPISDACVSLGKQLFFDPRLSGDNNRSCASCHNPAFSWTDGLATASGIQGQALRRATPTLINVAFEPLLFWDGRSRSLEHQALIPVQNSEEMNQPLDGLVKELSALQGYRGAFETAYPGKGINADTIGMALACFERTITSRNSPFDRWLAGDHQAMSLEAIRGFELFRGKGRCNLCHSGFNFTDNGFHNIGLKDGTDPGRYGIRKLKLLQGTFKTPTLRDIARTAPYMHNGSYRTLMEVMEHYNRGGDSKANLSPLIQPLNLSRQELADLVAFMQSLSGEPAHLEFPSLPER